MIPPAEAAIGSFLRMHGNLKIQGLHMDVTCAVPFCILSPPAILSLCLRGQSCIYLLIQR